MRVRHVAPFGFAFTVLFIFALLFGNHHSALHKQQADIARSSRHPSVVSVDSSFGKAATYIDGLLQDPNGTRASICKNFAKRSQTVVVYLCYERAAAMAAAMSALFKSERLQDFDLIISQDGGSSYVLNVSIPAKVNHCYVRHKLNIGTGMHSYFVKSLAFDIMAYERLVVVEEDNILHPQAIQVLNGMLDISDKDPEIGVVSITELDVSMLIYTQHYSAAVLRVDARTGHLWVYAMTKSRYHAISAHLRDYYNVIKGHEYRNMWHTDVEDAITVLRRSKNMPPAQELSQDVYFLNALQIEGYTKRLTTLVRLLEPVGFGGMHFQETAEEFYRVFGRGMYEGRVSASPYELNKNASEVAKLRRDCQKRLAWLYKTYLGREAPEVYETYTTALMQGRLNGHEVLRNLFTSEEHMQRAKMMIRTVGAL